MRSILSVLSIASTVVLATGCADFDVDPVGESQSSVIVVSPVPTPVPVPTASVAFPDPMDYKTFITPICFGAACITRQFVPDDCRFIVVTTYRGELANHFRSVGVCTRSVGGTAPRVVWHIDGLLKDFGGMNAKIGNEVASEVQMGIDVAMGGAGDFTKVGPKGPQPGPGGPGGTDPRTAWFIDFSEGIAAQHEASFAAAEQSWGCTPGATYCPTP